MTGRNATTWWLSEFVDEVLKDEVSTEVVRKIVETDYVAWHTKELSKDITQHLQDANKAGRIDRKKYDQSALSSDIKSIFEPLGIVHRISKPHQDSSTGFHTPGITDFLAKQDWDALQEIDPIELIGQDFKNVNSIDTTTKPETEAIMAYLRDRSIEDPEGPRHVAPLEAIIYMRTNQVASLLNKEVFVEYGSPSDFSDEANDVVKELYEETADQDPLPPFPQHEENYQYDHCTHFGIVGCVRHIENVYRPYQLRANIQAELQEWAASAFELSFNQYSDDHSATAKEDTISLAIHELNESNDDEMMGSELFKSRVFVDGDRVVFGINCRTNKNMGKTTSLAENIE